MLTVVEPSRWQCSSLYRSLRKLTGGRDSLAHALQWMLMLACQVKYLCHLRVSDVVGIDTARTDTLIMDLKHDPSGGLAVLTEYPLQYVATNSIGV